MSSNEDKIPEKTEKLLNENNIEEKKYKIVYSPYGYLKILEKDINNNQLSLYNFIQYKNSYSDNYFKGSVHKDNIKEYIDIRVKYFTGNRKIVTFEKININSKLNILIEKLFIDDTINNDKKNLINNDKKYTKNSQHRLYSSIRGLRELNTGITIYENGLKDNELLIYFAEVPLYFSSTMKGRSIELSQLGKTAFKTTTDDPQYILGNYGYFSGRHYFEISLSTDPMIRSVVVGLSNKKNENNLLLTDIQKFYGYILSDMKKTIITFGEVEQEDMNDYGEMCNINDKVGVLFDCRDDGVHISFYRNKKYLGIAFDKLPNNVMYFPTVEMGLCGSKIQIYNDVDFPDNI